MPNEKRYQGILAGSSPVLVQPSSPFILKAGKGARSALIPTLRAMMVG